MSAVLRGRQPFSRLVPSSSFKSSVARSRRPVRAFTLLEVLLTIAIIALLAGALVGGSARLLNEQPVSVDDIFWRAVREARKTALKAEHDIRLRYDKEKKQFVIVDGVAPAVVGADGMTKEEVPLKTFPLPPAAATDLTVEFLAAASKGGNLNLIAGMLVDTQTISHVSFYSDGTCQPFRLQIMRNGAMHALAIDPWTCAEVLTPPDPNAPVNP
jgi:prepilin-type N-terminal cleavage/methylation domain-containing protein